MVETDLIPSDITFLLNYGTPICANSSVTHVTSRRRCDTVAFVFNF